MVGWYMLTDILLLYSKVNLETTPNANCHVDGVVLLPRRVCYFSAFSWDSSIPSRPRNCSIGAWCAYIYRRDHLQIRKKAWTISLPLIIPIRITPLYALHLASTVYNTSVQCTPDTFPTLLQTGCKWNWCLPVCHTHTSGIGPGIQSYHIPACLL